MIPTPAIQAAPLDGQVRFLPPKSGEGVQTPQPATGETAPFRLQLDERVREWRAGGEAHRTPSTNSLVTHAVPAVAEVSSPLPPDVSRTNTTRTIQSTKPSSVPAGSQLVPPPASAVEGVGAARWQSVARSWREFVQWSDASEAQIRARGLAPDHPLVTEFHDEQRRRLIGLQLELGAAQFQMELVSKVIEHGTGGARQVLQTQA